MNDLFILFQEYGIIILIGLGLLVMGGIWLVTAIRLKALENARKSIKI